MSDVTSAPASFLKAIPGRRTAPIKSARSAKYFRIVELALSMVNFVVTTAMIPPGRSRSMDFAKK